MKVGLASLFFLQHTSARKSETLENGDTFVQKFVIWELDVDGVVSCMQFWNHCRYRRVVNNPL